MVLTRFLSKVLGDRGDEAFLKLVSIGDDKVILREAETFTVPDPKKVKTYISAITNVTRDTSGNSTNKVNEMFELVKYIDQESSNGVVYVVKVKGAKSEYAKLLVKVAKSKDSDPASYEYYVGLALNELRYLNIPNFSLVYGRFQCGFDPVSPGSRKTAILRNVCNSRYDTKTHVLYEYIATKNDESITLESYIKKMRMLEGMEMEIANSNLMNILLMLMVSLQHAQDKLRFTHYDLHMENILLVRLNGTYRFKYEYGGKKYNIILDYFPFIIDYGRSHVNPEMVDKVVQGKIIDNDRLDTDKDREYNRFKTYQQEVWYDRLLYLNNKSRSDKNILTKINVLLKSKLKDDAFKSKVYDVIHKVFETSVSKEDIDSGVILDAFYVNPEYSMITHGIEPTEFSEQFDHYKLTRLVCDRLNRSGVRYAFWEILENELDKAYPFYIPTYYHLPTPYPSFTGKFTKPIHVADFIYSVTQIAMNKGMKMKKVERISIDQFGGGMNKVDKMKRCDGEALHKKICKQLKMLK